MNLDDLTDDERRDLADAVHTGMHELLTRRRRNGATYDPTTAQRVLDALRRERIRSPTRPDPIRWVTITDVVCATPSEAPAPSTLTRWARTEQVRARKAGGTWLIDRDDLNRKLREDHR